MHESRHILEIKKAQIETSLVALFDLVKNAIANSMACLNSRDVRKCRNLVQEDIKLNELRRIIEQDCLVAIASQQPVANDLRDLVADMRIAEELERMGDYASDIASSIQRMDESSLDDLQVLTVLQMAEFCQRMLADVMRAHRTSDATLARQAGAMDDQLDAQMKLIVDAIMGAMRTDPTLINNGSRMLWIAHNLERCGDRATNIAEQIIFRVEGKVEELD